MIHAATRGRCALGSKRKEGVASIQEVINARSGSGGMADHGSASVVSMARALDFGSKPNGLCSSQPRRDAAQSLRRDAAQHCATQSWQRLRSAGTCVSKTIVVKKHPKHTGKKRELNSERTKVPRELTRDV